MKFSVITVVYNGAEHLEQTIKSVIEQKDAEIEYIIIDGGSTDGTIDIIRKYEKHIEYWVSEADNGLFDAMNKGIAAATGDVISFINSDDWYEENCFCKVVQCFANEKADIVYGIVNKIVNGHVDGYIGIDKETDLEILHYRNLYCHPGLFARKEIFDIIGDFNIHYKICADYDWILRAYNHGYSFLLLPQAVANFRMGGVSTFYNSADEVYEVCMKELNGHNEFIPMIEIEREKRREEKAINNVLREEETLQGILPEGMPFFIWGAGVYGKKCLKLLKQKQVSVLGFIDSFPVNKQFEQLPVYSGLEYFEKNSVDNSVNKYGIIVASLKYEEEILKQIQEKEYEDRYVITYREIIERIIQKY